MIKYNKQRNYRRNGDIIYHDNFPKKNTTSILYQPNVESIASSSFTLNETDGNLYYNDDIEETQEYTRGTITKYVVPYKYIWIDANGEMVLYADCPDVIDNSFFELNQTDGHFYINAYTFIDSDDIL